MIETTERSQDGHDTPGSRYAYGRSYRIQRDGRKRYGI
jgi:hypothetical protein